MKKRNLFENIALLAIASMLGFVLYFGFKILYYVWTSI